MIRRFSDCSRCAAAMGWSLPTISSILRRGRSPLVLLGTVFAVLVGPLTEPRAQEGGLPSCGDGQTAAPWLLARDWLDLGTVDPLHEPTPFAEMGWKRVAAGLAAIAADPKARTAVMGGDLQSLLAGPALERYCGAIHDLSAEGAIKLDVPLELLEARTVLEALGPALLGLVGALPPTAPPVEMLSKAVLDGLGGVVEDRRLARYLRLVASENAALRAVPRPGGWPAEAAWPPEPARLEQLAGLLDHGSPGELQLCGEAQPMRVSAATAGPGERQRARGMVDAMGRWAAACAAVEPRQASVDAPSAPKIGTDPAALTRRGDREQAKTGAACTDVPIANVGFQPERPPLGPTRFRGSLVLVLGEGCANEQRFDLGIRLDDVEQIDRDGQLGWRVRRDALTPKISPVNREVLGEALRRFGLPPAVELADVNITLNDTLTDISLSLEVAVPVLALRRTLPLVLVKQGTTLEPSSSVQEVVAQLEADALMVLKSTSPTLSIGDAGSATSLQVSNVRFDPSRAVLRLDGTLAFPEPDWLTAHPVEASAELDVSVASAGSARLTRATVPSAVVDRLGGDIAAALDADELEPGRATCLELIGLTIKDDGPGRIALTATAALRGSAARLTIPLAWPPASPTALAGTLARADPAALAQCVLSVVLNREGLGIDLEAAYRELEGKELRLLGQTLRVVAPRWQGRAKGQFRIDLVADADPAVRLPGVAIDGSWRPGSPLQLSQVSLVGASLPTNFVTTALAGLNPVLGKLVTISSARIEAGRIEIAALLHLPGLEPGLPIESISLDPADAQDALLRVLNGALLDGVERGVDQLQPALVELGPIGTPSLLRSESDLLRPALVFKVPLRLHYGVELGVRVALLPNLEVTPLPDLDLTSLLMPVAGQAAKLLGDLPLGNTPISKPNLVIDQQRHRYGIAFNLAVKLGDTIRVSANGLVLDQHGINPPPTFGLEEPVPILAGLITFNGLKGTLEYRPLQGRFEVRSPITLTSDVEQIVALDGRIIGDGPNRTLTLKGDLKAVRQIKLFRYEGVADLNNRRIWLNSESDGPLADILKQKSRLTLDFGEGEVEAEESVASLLGLKVGGTFRLQTKPDAQASINGGARFSDLGTASVGLTSGPDLRQPKGSGKINVDVLGLTKIGAEFNLDPSVVEFRFKAFKASLRIIAPSVEQIDLALIERLLRSLFDFKLSLEALKHREIVVNLIPPEKGDTEPTLGGGDPIEEGGRHAKEVPVDLPDDGGERTPPPKPELPPSITATGGIGSWNGIERTWDKCVSLAIKQPYWYRSQDFPDVAIEGEWAPGQPTFNTTHGRIASDATYSELKSSPIIACVHINALPKTKWTSPWHQEYADSLVAVVGRSTQPAALRLLIFRYKVDPIDLPLPPGADEVIFGMAASDASAHGWELREGGQALLEELARIASGADLSGTVEQAWPIVTSDLVPGWPSEPSFLVRRKAHDGVIEYAFRTASGAHNHPAITPRDPLFGIVDAAPQGPAAALIAAVNAKAGRELELLAGSASGCQVLAARDAHQLVLLGVDGVRLGLAPVETQQKAVPATLRDNGLAASLCALLASGGRKILVAAGRDQDTDLLVLRLHGEDREPWWALLVGQGSTPSHGPACIAEADLRQALQDEGAVRDPTVAQLATSEHRHVLAEALVGDRPTRERAFFVNPRGLFLSRSAACP